MKISSLQFTYICIWHLSIMFSHVAPPPLHLLYALGNRESASKQYLFIVSSAEMIGKRNRLTRVQHFYSNFRTYNPMILYMYASYYHIIVLISTWFKQYRINLTQEICVQGISLGYARENKKNKRIGRCHI